MVAFRSLAIIAQIEALMDGKEAAIPTSELATRPTQADFARMIRRRQRELHAITNKLIDGELTPDSWAYQFEAILLEGHTSAWEMGRNRAGDLTDDLADLLRGSAAADGERYYLHGFLNALKEKDPRYWDDELQKYRETIKSRQNLYLGKMRGTANQAFVDHTDDELDEFTWVMAAFEEHCSECPEYAAMSPWTKATLFAVPGDGETPCLTNCKCHLVRSDGETSFKPVEL